MSNELLGDFIEFDKVYELNIGKTVQKESRQCFNQFKYDFTPASIDRTQEAQVTIGARNDVLIQVPHVDGSNQKYTQFTGNKQPCSTKECILIYNTKTNEFTLERLESNFILKRSRVEGTSKAQMITPRSVTPTNEGTNKKKSKAAAAAATGQQAAAVDSKSSATSVQSNTSSKSGTQQQQQQQIKSKEISPSPKSVAQLNTDELFGKDLNLSEEDSNSDSSTL